MNGIGNYVSDGTMGLGGAIGAGYPYTVKSGDTLTGIAYRFGRQPAEWLDLLKMNANVLGSTGLTLAKNPNVLKIGSTLELPAGWPSSPTRSGNPPASWGPVPRPPVGSEMWGTPPAVSPPLQVTPAPPAPPAPPAAGGSNTKIFLAIGGLALIGLVLGPKLLKKGK